MDPIRKITFVVLLIFLNSCNSTVSDNIKKKDEVSELNCPDPSHILIDDTVINPPKDGSASIRRQIGLAVDKKENVPFRSIADISENEILDKGLKVNDYDWPGVLHAFSCTSALIGPDVILTAAHCVDAENHSSKLQTINPKLYLNGNDYDLICEMNPKYSESLPKLGHIRNENDHALCYIRELLSPLKVKDLGSAIKNSTLFETIDISGNYTRPGEIVTMVGYGCDNYAKPTLIKESGVSDRLIYDLNLNDYKLNIEGTLRIKENTVGCPSTNTEVSIELRAFGASDDPSLCRGDSGGPLFSGHQVGKPGDHGNRRVVGVNSTVWVESVYSRSNPKVPLDYRFESTVAGIGNKSFIDFLESWAVRNQKKVCLNGYQGQLDIVSKSKLCRW